MKALRASFGFSLSVIMVLCGTAQGQHVLYGERSVHELAVYLDCEGSPYPDIRISNEELEAANGSLHEWYSRNPEKFSSICEQYSVPAEIDMMHRIQNLDEQIFHSISGSILSASADSAQIVFMVHGYRKPYTPVSDTRTSIRDFEDWERALLGSDKAIYPVKVFWDGMYDCCFSMSPRKNKPHFEVFMRAREQAKDVGVGLSGVISGLNGRRVEIQTHSLGAMVAVHCLGHLEKTGYTALNGAGIELTLIAPALAPADVENLYQTSDAYSRGGWRINLLCNRKDIVLRKKDFVLALIGPGPYKFGDTSLGCNHRKAATELSERLAATCPDAPVRVIDMYDVGKCHHITCYLASSLYPRNR